MTFGRLGALGRGFGRMGTGGISANDPTIQISSTSIAEDASIGDLVGTLSVSHPNGSYTFTIASNPDSKFVLDLVDNTRLELGATLDYETATSHLVTIEADNDIDAVLSRQFTITVTDVAEGGGSAGEPIGLLLTLTKAA
jgi:hypothetical protein